MFGRTNLKWIKKFCNFVNRFGNFELDESPELSTYKGYHTGNDKLDEFTTAAYKRRKVLFRFQKSFSLLISLSLSAAKRRTTTFSEFNGFCEQTFTSCNYESFAFFEMLHCAKLCRTSARTICFPVLQKFGKILDIL